MASSSSSHKKLGFCFLLFSLIFGIVAAQLSSEFYATSCPDVSATIKAAVESAVNDEKRMGASLLRLHFHDCFVQASHFFTSSSSFIFLLHFTYILFRWQTKNLAF